MEADSSKWESLSIKCSNMQEATDAQMSEEQVSAFYIKSNDGVENPVALADILELSRALSEQVEDYRHSNY